MNKIAVIGSGTMGNGIAHCFAQKGFEVYLVDISNSTLTSQPGHLGSRFSTELKKLISSI